MGLDEYTYILAERLRGRTRYEAEKYLISHGMTIAGAAAAVAQCLGSEKVVGRGPSVTGTVEDIQSAIEHSLP